MVIAVTGASGHLGRLIVKQLETKGWAGDVVALARTPAKAADLGVVVREADYTQPDSVNRALAGVDVLMFVSASQVGQRIAQHRNIIAAAQHARVKWIVYTSLLHADTSSITSLASEHVATEEALKASGIPVTILRNGWYTENYTASIPGALAGGAFIGCADDGKISGAMRVDYADAAVAVLTGQGQAGKTYELAGDEAFTLSALAAELSRQTRSQIPYRDLSEADYAAMLKGFGLPEDMALTYAAYDTAAARGALFDDGRQLSRLIGRPTTPLSTAVAEALKQMPAA